ncbi:hypothetical protein SNE40_015039 [Patella caerulea]|uniref:Stabilin-2 n=1 Tax=Patella caerulea TaxID=87958 RepID=A0AAN8JJ47_PATCE
MNLKYCNGVTNVTFYTPCRSCIVNENVDCSVNAIKLTTDKGLSDCSFVVTIKQQSVRLPGCRHECQREVLTMKCCGGFWGADCDECPGGAIQPCNGRGVCSDGETGTGECKCQENFSGISCEKCSNETLYGETCSEVCECVNGTCNSGIQGDGSCLCYSGFSGALCDQVLEECNNFTCENNSRCIEVNNTTTCVCDPGYEKTDENSTVCTAIDACLSNPCQVNAECYPTGPAKHECSCKPNYSGDGINCYPIDPCQVNYGGCVTNSSVCEYRSPNKSECVCLIGYEGYQPDLGCRLIDVCINKSVVCHDKATCKTTGPGRYQCSCPPGYVGDGKQCYTNIIQTLSELNEKDGMLVNQLHISYRLLKVMYNEALSQHGPFTIFVPFDRGYKSILKTMEYGDLMNDADFSRQIIRQHIIIGQFSLEKLSNYSLFYTMEGNTAELNFRSRQEIFKYRIHGNSSKSKVMKGNILASNGIIHITNSLLTLVPEVKGNSSRSILDLIRTEGRYNRFQTLITVAGMEAMFEQENITVFAPENGAWDSLPKGSVDYLTSNLGKKRLKIIVENHIFKGRISVADLINKRVLQSLANNAVNVTITEIGQIRLNNAVNISQTDIPSKNGIYHHIESVLVPDSIKDIIPKRCDIKSYRVVNGICGSCLRLTDLRCPSESVSLNKVSQGCRYWVNVQKRYIPLTGCQQLCNRTYSINKCCAGFYGQECLECPGGFMKPCNGNGRCMDDIYGNGTCVCNEGFTGPTCEYCAKKDFYGPTCSQKCGCLYGICHDGIKGVGLCKANSCFAGYKGKNCNKKLMQCGEEQQYCHVHSNCYKQNGHYECVCKSGYQYVYGECQEIDPCSKSDRGGCHLQATCTKVGPDMPKCDCNKGWIGDGFYCYPATPCSQHQDCHPDAECSDLEPGSFNCICKIGFHGNGTVCVVSNVCQVNNGGCHEKAICTSTGHGTKNCTCGENYGGDGYTCYASISEEIKIHPNLTLLAKLLNVLDENDDILNLIESNYTFFAPTDDAMSKLLGDGEADYWKEDENILSMIRFHTLDKEFDIESLKQLAKFYGRFDTLFDGYSISIAVKSQGVFLLTTLGDEAKIIQSDIPALNGYIHIIDQVLEPFLPDADQPDLEEFFSTKPEYSFFGQQLDQKDLIEYLEGMEEYTLLVPTNEAFLEINSTISRKFLQYYIIPKIYLTAALEDGQMITTSLGTDHRLQFTVKNRQMYVNDIRIENANQLTLGGVVHGLSGILHPVINRCDETYTNQSFGPCVPCQQQSYPCPENFKPRVPPVIIRNICTITQSTPDGKHMNTLGCHSLCYYQQVILQCCSGYYGENCLECPGGPETPCSGHGICRDGINGTGDCLCDERFRGFRCNECEEGLTGTSCNITINSCDYLNGNCSQHATCQKVDGHVTCLCKPGFVGNGHVCQSPCDVHKNICDSHANCHYDTTNHLLRCECFEGYHGNGTWCEEIVNQCVMKNGGCSRFAQCIFEPPATTSLSHGSVNCECLTGYVGDGILCTTDVLNALSQLSQASNFYQGVTSLNSRNITDLLSDREGRITLFVPVDNESTKQVYSEDDVKKYIIDAYVYINITLIFTNNSYLHCLSGEIKQITYNNKQFYVNGIHIVRMNIPTLNGLIHLIESPLLSTPTKVDNSARSSSNISVIVGPIIAILIVVVIIVVIIVVLYYKRARSTGFLNFMKRYRKGSDDSFAHLQGSSEEDQEPDLLQQPGNINYNNPIYQASQDDDDVEQYDN